MSNFKKELSALYAKQKQELQSAITTYLNTEFKDFFEKHPYVNSVKINAGQQYNDSDYDTIINDDSETIKVNGYSFCDLDGEDWDDDEVIENIGMTHEQHENVAEIASAIFDQIADSVLIHVYGNSFGVKIDRIGITLEISDIESY